MRETWELARDLLASPRRAVERFQRSDAALTPAMRLYLASLVVAVAFYSLKPADFPAPPPDYRGLIAEEQGGLLFWTKVQVWEPVLTAVWVVFMVWFADLLKGGRLALRMGGAAALGAAPILPILLYTNHAIGKGVFLGIWCVLLAAMAPGLRRRSPESWKPILSLTLALDVVNLALLVPFTAAILLRSETGYHALEMVMLFWTLGLGSYALSRLEGIATPRAFAAIFLSMLSQLLFIVSLYLLGLVPKEVLKALMAV